MNYFKETLDIDVCKQLIKDTRKGEICILCPHYSINIQVKYYQDETLDPESMNWDFEELEKELGQTLFVSDFDDLCCDPHGVMNEENETYEFPTVWASYLINGDSSGLEQSDIDLCDRYTKDIGSCIQVSEESHFGIFIGIGYDLSEYKFRK